MLFVICALLVNNNCPNLRGCTSCNKEGTSCYNCDASKNYNPSPSNGKCICNAEKNYYDLNGVCKLASNESCEIGCQYCFVSNTKKCGKCNSEEHYTLNYDQECVCDYSKHFVSGKGDEADKCVCKEGYHIDDRDICMETRKECFLGCEECFYFDSSCVKCKPNFEKSNLDKYECECKEGYYLDEYEDESKNRCLEAFQNCPEGCNCDQGSGICKSCNEGFMPQYFDDYTTVRSCFKVHDCSSTGSCQTCDEDGNCLICKEGYIYSQFLSECILKDDNIDCYVGGCKQCNPADFHRCDVCATGFDSVIDVHGDTVCEIQTVNPIKVIYLLLKDENIIDKSKTGEISFNLEKIDNKKIVPYYYDIQNEDSKIIINNNKNINFQLRLPYNDYGSYGDYQEYTIESSGSNQNPQYSILSKGLYKLNYQSTETSIEGKGNITLNSERNPIELNKLTVADEMISINHEKNLAIKEINAYGKYARLYNNPNNPNKDLKISTKTMILHQNSGILNDQIKVETLKFASQSHIESNNIEVDNIEINILEKSMKGNNFPFIEGNIYGIPKSIKLNIDEEKPSLLSERPRYYQTLHIARAKNQEFHQNCEKWAKLYNDNPTFQYMNKAECISNEETTNLEIRYEEKSKGKNVGMIVGIVIACVVVVGLVVFLLVYFLVIKKRKQNDKSSSQQDDE